jgi:hypothetical protein
MATQQFVRIPGTDNGNSSGESYIPSLEVRKDADRTLVMNSPAWFERLRSVLLG